MRYNNWKSNCNAPENQNQHTIGNCMHKSFKPVFSFHLISTSNIKIFAFEEVKRLFTFSSLSSWKILRNGSAGLKSMEIFMFSSVYYCTTLLLVMTISSGPGQGHCRYILPLSKNLMKNWKKLFNRLAVRVRSGRKRVLHREDVLRLVSFKTILLKSGWLLSFLILLKWLWQCENKRVQGRQTELNDSIFIIEIWYNHSCCTSLDQFKTVFTRLGKACIPSWWSIE